MKLNLKLSTKLLLAFLCVGVIPACTIGLIALTKSSNALEEQSYNQLVSMRDVKKTQIENFFHERQSDIDVLVENVGVMRKEAFAKLSAVQQLKRSQVQDFFKRVYEDVSVLSKNAVVKDAVLEFDQAFETDGKKTGQGNWNGVEKNYGSWFTSYMNEYGYYDLFLISADGDVVYTVCKEPDLGGNCVNGELADTGLGKCFSRAQDGVAIADFEAYAPSGGVQACFIGAPVKQDGKTVGVIALQVPTKPINAIVQKREGMGTSGETYLFGDYEGVGAFRSDMLTMGDGKFVIGYSIPAPEYIKKALGGEQVENIFTDSSGKLVMVCAEPMELKGLEWICVSKIDFEEAISHELEGSSEDFFTKYNNSYGYYDLFLIAPNGHCFYSVCNEADYNTNLVSGKYSSSNLGELTRNVLETRQFGMVDFAPYAPSNGDPAAFIAQPLVSNGKVELVVALQVSLEAINGIMQQRAGMGETGETYLVGDDYRMRSDSFLDPEGHSVLASFAGTVDSNGCRTEASELALSGQTDAKLIMDYNGNPVLSAFTPVDIHGLHWALLAEIDKTEAFAARNSIMWMMTVITAVSVCAILTTAILITRSITVPVRRIINSLREGSEQVAEASGQVSMSSQSLAEGATEQAAGLEETSSSLEEMSSMTKSNAENAGQANKLADEATTAANSGNESMGRMNTAIEEIQKSSDETAKIIKVIDEIAFQTNLLALNAAVEAARAGEAGKGFAVVAEEVRNLAMRSAEAAKNTSEMIQESVKNSQSGVDIVKEVASALERITDRVSKTKDLVSEISEASNEQAQGVEQVNQAVTQMDKVTQQNAASAEESASAAEELSAQAEQMQGIVSELVGLVEGSSEVRANVSTSGSSKSKKQAGQKAGKSDSILHHIAHGSQQHEESTVESSD